MNQIDYVIYLLITSLFNLNPDNNNINTISNINTTIIILPHLREKQKAIQRGRSVMKQSKKEIQLATALITVQDTDPFKRSEFHTVFLQEEEHTMLKYAQKSDLENGKIIRVILLFIFKVYIFFYYKYLI